MKYSIGIDARMIQHSGIGTYLRGLLSGLSTMNISLDDFCLFRPLSFPRKRESNLDPPVKPEDDLRTIEFNSKLYSVGEQFAYPSRVSQCRLWHSPHYNVPLLKGKTRLVVTIHDLIHWIFRKDFFTPLQAAYAGFMLRQAIQKADRVITVSEKTKEDLVHYFQAPAEKISVIYEGVAGAFRPLHDPEKIREIKKKYQLPESFFLYVGLLKAHKNVHGLLRAFRRSKEQKTLSAGLVIVGKKDKAYRPELRELAELETGNGVHYLSRVEGDDLITLYNAALALVHPSFYEGFGLTLLEAMACGLPVIACRAASIPEVAGDAALLVPPGEEDALIEAMQKVETDSQLRQRLILNGHKRVIQFSWSKMAQKTYEIYQQVLNAN